MMVKKANKTLIDTLKKMADAGLIVPRKENNQYLVLSYKGAGGLITHKWNIKIYNTGSFVCADPSPIREFLHGRLKSPDPSLRLIQIDDAGWGSSIGGVMVGVCCDNRVVTAVVDTAFFKPGPYDSKQYLQVYANKGLILIEREFNASIKTHRIEICTGYVNKDLRELLRSEGYDVRTVEITGMLQDTLEDLFKAYIKELTGGVDLAYDPKNCKSGKEISNLYYRSVNWARENAPHLLKTGSFFTSAFPLNTATTPCQEFAY